VKSGGTVGGLEERLGRHWFRAGVSSSFSPEVQRAALKMGYVSSPSGLEDEAWGLGNQTHMFYMVSDTDVCICNVVFRQHICLEMVNRVCAPDSVGIAASITNPI
jgi:hypothetical protein